MRRFAVSAFAQLAAIAASGLAAIGAPVNWIREIDDRIDSMPPLRLSGLDCGEPKYRYEKLKPLLHRKNAKATVADVKVPHYRAHLIDRSKNHGDFLTRGFHRSKAERKGRAA